jgi:4-hydroxy-tetrahydrodipicolinate reductase
MRDIAVGVVGIGGRMGRMIAAQLLDGKGVSLAGGTLRPGSAGVGGSLSDLLGRADAVGVAEVEPGPLFSRSDSVIDFTLPEALPAHLAAARVTGTPFVVGITGLS